MRVWRIVRDRWATSAFDGEGAARRGNRWNSKGVRIVYASPSLALAALEILVHANPTDLPGPFVAIGADLPEDLRVKAISAGELPSQWRSYPAPRALQSIGDDWVAQGNSAVLRVPSVIIPLEDNILLNPLHPDFGRLRIHPPIPFQFDSRLGQR